MRTSKKKPPRKPTEPSSQAWFDSAKSIARSTPRHHDKVTLIHDALEAIGAGQASRIYPFLEKVFGSDWQQANLFSAENGYVLKLQVMLLTCNQLSQTRLRALGKNRFVPAAWDQAKSKIAVKAARSKIKLTRSLKYKIGWIIALSLLSLDVSDSEQAIKAAQSALTLSKRSTARNKNWLRVWATAILAYAYFHSRQFERARKCFEAAETLYSKLNRKGTAAGLTLRNPASDMYCRLIMILDENRRLCDWILQERQWRSIFEAPCANYRR